MYKVLFDKSCRVLELTYFLAHGTAGVVTRLSILSGGIVTRMRHKLLKLQQFAK
jgi:hypothetical protein